MKTVIFDIETVGCALSQLDDFSQHYFLKFTDDEEIAKVEDCLSFYPLTAQVVAIGMMDAQTHEGAVYFQDGGNGIPKFDQEGVHFQAADECGMLERFWNKMRHYDRFVTFNGRGFDCPFLMIRSAVHSIRIERNLVPYRYSALEHVDLADQLSFYGCLSRKFPLHMWCNTFGIPSPKQDGMTGLQVKTLFHQGRFVEIAQYCLDDVIATGKLFDVWKGVLSLEG